MKKYLIMLLSAICLCMTPVYALESPVQKSAQMYRDAIVWKYKNINTEYMYYYLSTVNIESFGCRMSQQENGSVTGSRSEIKRHWI